MDRITAEMKAMQSLVALMEQANECKRLFETAGLGLPEPLARFLGDQARGHRAPSLIIPPPEAPPVPPGISGDAIWVRIEDATPTALLLAVLRGAGGPMAPARLFDRVLELNPRINRGSLANIGSRLGGNLIDRGDNGWTLSKPTQAPLLAHGVLWGETDVFGKYELAAHRRYGVIHVLKLNPGGLQAVQLLEQLQSCPWLKAPLGKDLLKQDLEELEKEEKVKPTGRAHKWVVTAG